MFELIIQLRLWVNFVCNFGIFAMLPYFWAALMFQRLHNQLGKVKASHSLPPNQHTFYAV